MNCFQLELRNARVNKRQRIFYWKINQTTTHFRGFVDSQRTRPTKLVETTSFWKKKCYLSGSEQYGNKGRHSYKSFIVTFVVGFTVPSSLSIFFPQCLHWMRFSPFLYNETIGKSLSIVSLSLSLSFSLFPCTTLLNVIFSSYLFIYKIISRAIAW